MIQIIIICFLSFFSSYSAIEYLYPVARIQTEKFQPLILMHQTEQKKMRVLVWDPRTQQIEPALAQRYNPAGVQVLPNQTGFSFIENDLLKIQYFSQRSPKTVTFDEPVYSLSIINWINSTNYYFSAKDEEQFGIYQGNIWGCVDPVLVSSEFEYLYPQKVRTTLFCVRRTGMVYDIVQTEYPSLEQLDADVTKEKVIERLRRISERKSGAYDLQTCVDVICACPGETVAFLNMVSDHEGFYLSYPRQVIASNRLLTCSYNQLVKEPNNTTWRRTKLFNFSLPIDIIQHTSSKGLCESIYPLLPYFWPEGDALIYAHVYMDETDKERWTCKLYNLKKRSETQLTCSTFFPSFGFIIYGKNIYSGGLLSVGGPIRFFSGVSFECAVLNVFDNMKFLT